MARLVAIEWDAREARVAVASPRGEGIVLEQAFVVALGARAEGQSDDDRDAEIGDQLAAALDKHRVGHGQALVAIARAAIQLKQLSLPPAPDEELPDLVRFQAMRDFNSLGEDWPLDYVPLGNNPAEPRQVLAVALDPDLLVQIRGICQRAGLQAERLILRPYAAASLFLRRAASSEHRAGLLIDILGEEADLTVLVDETVVFLRTARLPAELMNEPESCRPLLAEIRRTLAAVTNQLGGQKVEAIYLCGGQAAHEVLRDHIAKEFGLALRTFGPADSGLGKPDGTQETSLPGGDATQQAIFRSDIGVDNEAVRLPNNDGYVWFDLTKIDPPRERGFDEVKAEVEKQWRADEVASRLSAQAREIVQKLDAGEKLDAIAFARGLALDDATLGRQDQSEALPRNVVSLVFGTPAGKAGSAAVENAGRVVFQVKAATIGPYVRTTEDAESFVKLLTSSISEDLLAQYVGKLQNDLGVQINQAALRNATGGQN